MKDKSARHRARSIINVATELRHDSIHTRHGLAFDDYPRESLWETIEDCTGYHLSEPERRLSVVAYEEGADSAKSSIWYP